MEFQISGLKANENQNYSSLKKFRLAQNNPRFTVINELDGDTLINSITNCSDRQQTVAEALFFHEGNLKNLISLVKSICETGFDSSDNKIILVQGQNKNNYFVAEGNRRIMVLKLLNGELTCPEQKNLNPSDSSEDLIHDEDQDEIKSQKKNYKTLQELLSKMRHFFQDSKIKIDVRVESKSLPILKAIFNQHITGERPGMRKWSRGQNFLHLLRMFKKGIDAENKDLLKKIKTNLRREPALLIQDFKDGQFVREILKTKFPNKQKKVELLMQTEKVTALQANFALKRIKDVAKKLMGITSESFKNDYFNFEFSKQNNLLLPLKNKKIKYTNVLLFIYKWWQKGVITTRPIVDNKKTEFNNNVIRLLQGKDDKKISELTKQDLENEIGFSLTLQELKEYEKLAEKKGWTSESKKFKKVKNFKKSKSDLFKGIKNLFSKINNQEKLWEPIGVFWRLTEQWIYLTEKDAFYYIYLNGQFATIRSLIEQIVYWSDCSEKIIENDDKLYRVISDLKENLDKGKKEEEVRRLLSRLLDDPSDDKFATKIIFIFSKWDEIINEFIHASHRSYMKFGKKIDLDVIDYLNELIEIMKLFFEKVNIEKLSDINSKFYTLLLKK